MSKSFTFEYINHINLNFNIMKLNLHTKLFLAVFGFTLLGSQAVSAQDYQGVPFTAVFPTLVEPLEIGTAVGVGDKVQVEYFDAMPGDDAGANIGATQPGNGIPGTYFDKSVDGDEQPSDENGKSQFRLGTDVDLKDKTDPADNTPIIVLDGNQGQEYQFYTIDVLTSGMYTIRVRYSHTSPDGQEKKMQVFLHNDPTDITGGSVVFNSSNSGANPPNMVRTYNIDELGDGELPAYGDSEETEPFELLEGTRLFRVRQLSAGWQVDYLTFTLQSTLSTNDLSLENEFKVFPNPSNTGQFNLSEDLDWGVYSILGAKILEGSGKLVDLSGVSKGTYILKTESETKKLIVN